MRILPVIDLMNGQVVRGVGGRRQEYRPIVSRLTTSSQPLDVAQAFRAHFGLTELYLADLDTVAGAAPAIPTYAGLRSLGFRLWVDAGIRTVEMAAPLAAAGVERIVLGLETVAAPAVIAEIGLRWGWERVVFSLDLKDGQPLGNRSCWDHADAESIAREVIALGVRRLIILDLAHVGGNQGTGTEKLCSQLAAAYPHVEMLAGGGVRDVADLRRLQQLGVNAVLVASALHDGGIESKDLFL